MCVYFNSGWSASDGRSKYNVDVSKIFADKVKLTNGRHIAYVEHGASREEAKINVLFVHGLLSSRLLGTSLRGQLLFFFFDSLLLQFRFMAFALF